MADIFISYARADRERIAALSGTLERAGWSVWWDRNIDGGSAFAQTIEAELRAAKVVVVAWSQAALQSDWVKDEAAEARDQGKLVPVSLDGSIPPLGFRQYHVIDFSGWRGDPSAPAIADLGRSLATRVASSGTTPQGPVPSPTAPGVPARSTTQRRNLVIAGVAALTLVVAAVLVLRGRHSEVAVTDSTVARRADASSPAATAPALDKSIAVLPFDNRSTRPDDAWFAEGMHDDLLTQLSKVGDLRVISRTSMARYAGTDKPIPEIASELGVGVVLEGAVQRAGDRVRINVQLVDGRTDTQLWAETFDRELTVANLFDIQSEITRAIATALKSVLASAGSTTPEQLPTRNIEAYNAFLLGNTLDRYELLDPALIRRAAAAYGEAIALDPDFAAAYARKAQVHLQLVWWGVDVPENIQLAEQALERARALAPDASDTRVAEGFYRYWVQGDYKGADAAARAALEQLPQDASLWGLRGAAVRRGGDMAASTAAFARALEIDPKNVTATTNLAINAAYLGDLAEANRWLERTRQVSPGTDTAFVETILLQLAGDDDAAWRRYEALRAAGGSDPTAQFGWLAFDLHDPRRLGTLATRLGDSEIGGAFGQSDRLAYAVALDRLGRQDEARAVAREVKSEFERFKPNNDDRAKDVRILGVALDALLGNAAAARAEAAALRKDPPRDYLWIVEKAPTLATAHAWLGEPDAAFDLIEQAMDEFSPVHFVNIRNNVAFDRYRDLPRYRKLDARYEAWKAQQPATPPAAAR